MKQEYEHTILNLLLRLERHEIDHKQALAELRPCYCPKHRWERWRDGIEAGEDDVLGTTDDVNIPDTLLPG